MKEILNLLSTYSLDQILVFIIMLSLAVKGGVEFFDWIKKRFSTVITDTRAKEQEKAEVSENIDKLFEMQKKQNEAIDDLTKSVNLLLRSDRDDIKAWITQQHHHYCYDLKYIDDFSLDCIEKRYTHYKDEGGNSFVEDLMIDLRSLKKVSSTLVRQETPQHHELPSQKEEETK